MFIAPAKCCFSLDVLNKLHSPLNYSISFNDSSESVAVADVRRIQSMLYIATINRIIIHFSWFLWFLILWRMRFYVGVVYSFSSSSHSRAHNTTSTTLMVATSNIKYILVYKLRNVTFVKRQLRVFGIVPANIRKVKILNMNAIQTIFERTMNDVK